MVLGGQCPILLVTVRKMFRILSLDGGGIKGVFTAAVLASFEADTKLKIIDHFDLIAGTSTGGMLAIGLAMGLTAEELLNFCRERGADNISGHESHRAVGATKSVRGTLTAMAAAASGTLGKRLRSALSPPMRSASTTWPATSPNGCRIATMTTREYPQTVPRGPVEFAILASFAAVPGRAIRRTSARPIASRTFPTTESSSLASVSGGRLPLENRYLCICWVQGEALAGNF
jgi:hypothetical protein